MTMTSQLSDITSSSIFWRPFVPLIKFSYWFNFHVNIITGSGVMIIFFYKGLTRKPEIGNTRVWVLHNIQSLGQVRDTKFDANISNKIFLIAAIYQGYSFYRFWVIKGKLTGEAGGITSPSPRLGLRNDSIIFCKDVARTSASSENRGRS